MKNSLTLLLVAIALTTTAQNSNTQNPNENAGSHATTGLKINTTEKKPKTTTLKTSKTASAKSSTKKTGGVKGVTGATSSQGKVIDVGSPGPTGNTGTTGNNGGSILPADAANAIKQALINGITTGVNKVSVTDGYFGNPAIKIPLPQEIQMVDEGLRMVGAGDYVDKLVLQINRSAEQSAVQATPIFLNAITQLSITDAVNIVNGQQPDAATQFLKRTTSDQLVVAFKPSVKAVLDKTYTTEIWNTVMGYYDKIPFVTPVNTDLSDYVTRKALDGLFYMVAQEEAKIRKDPAGQVSSILSKVFGKVLTLQGKN